MSAQISRSWVKVDGNHYPVCPITIDAESQQQAVWLRFWRFLATRGIDPFPAVRLCPCGYPDNDACPCLTDEPDRIAHETEVAIT